MFGTSTFTPPFAYNPTLLMHYYWSTMPSQGPDNEGNDNDDKDNNDDPHPLFPTITLHKGLENKQEYHFVALSLIDKLLDVM